MIREFYVHAKPANKKAVYAFFACLGSAIIVFAVYMLAEKYRGLISMGIMVFITAAVYIYNRYMGSEYFYDITFDHTGTPVFVVRQKIGKRESTLCRVDLGSIIRIDKMTAEERKGYKADAGVVRYTYCPTMMPEVVYRVAVRSHSEKADIFIEATDELAELLLGYSREAREE